MTLESGLTLELKHLVTEKDTAAAYGSGLVPVLSTPYLIALMENAAQASVAPHLDPGVTTVGTAIDMQHIAATPVGMEVRVQSKLIHVEGRRLHFHIEAWDPLEKIGTCEHTRVIIDKARFMKRVAEKLQAM